MSRGAEEPRRRGAEEGGRKCPPSLRQQATDCCDGPSSESSHQGRTAQAALKQSQFGTLQLW